MANLPAYMLIRQYVIEQTFTHENPEAPLMSERELSRKFGVSRTTAHKALEDLVRDGYLVPRPRSGLYLAPDCETPASGVYPKVLVLDGDGKYLYMGGFQLRICSILYSYLQTKPYRVCPVNLSGGCPPEEELSFSAASGILWIQAPGEMRENLEKVRKNCPVQELFSQTPGAKHSIRMDYREGGRLAVRYFKERGIFSPYLVGCGKSFIRQEFQSGWMEEIQKSGLDPFPERMIPLSGSSETELKKIFQKNPPEGIFSFGREYANASGLIPKNTPVLCDDTPYAEISSGIRRPDAILTLAPESVVRLAAEELFMQMRGAKCRMSERLIPPKIRHAN